MALGFLLPLHSEITPGSRGGTWDAGNRTRSLQGWLHSRQMSYRSLCYLSGPYLPLLKFFWPLLRVTPGSELKSFLADLGPYIWMLGIKLGLVECKANALPTLCLVLSLAPVLFSCTQACQAAPAENRVGGALWGPHPFSAVPPGSASRW